MKESNLQMIPVLALVCLVLAFPAHALEPEEFDMNKDSGFYYTIQKGDTLWHLSQKFYNSRWDWPGLWEMNKEIKNPHWIYPGNRIRVYLKPVVPRNQAPGTAPPVAAPVRQEPGVAPDFNYTAMDRIGFIRKTRVASLGTIIREQDGNVMMSADDIIYIKPSAPESFVRESRYQVFTTEKIKEKINGKTYQGIKHLVKADIEILESNKTYAVGKITNSYRDATVGDGIMAYYHRPTRLTVRENPPPIDAVLLCSEDNTLMVNDYSIAFINKGTDHRVAPGQIYSVLQTQDERSAFDGADAIALSPIYSGKLIVLQAEDIASTVMILASKRDIHPGDLVN